MVVSATTLTPRKDNMQQRELMFEPRICGVTAALRDSCLCLPIVWTDCGCVVETDEIQTTYGSAGSVAAFIRAIDFTRAVGYNNNRTGYTAPTSNGSDPPRADWSTYSIPPVPPLDGVLSPAVIAGLEISLDRLVADVTDQWFTLQVFVSRPQRVLSPAYMQQSQYFIEPQSVGFTIRMKIDLSTPKRIYVPMVRPSQAAISSGLDLLSGSLPAATQLARNTGMDGTATACFMCTSGNEEIDDRAIIQLWQDSGNGADPAATAFRATLRFISQDDAVLMRALTGLHEAVTGNGHLGDIDHGHFQR